jgi:hypothetical protein
MVEGRCVLVYGFFYPHLQSSETPCHRKNHQCNHESALCTLLNENRGDTNCLQERQAQHPEPPMHELSTVPRITLPLRVCI